MARNLQSKLTPADSIRIFDINKDAAQKLAAEMLASKAGGATVEVVDDVKHAARDAVSLALRFCLVVLLCCSVFDSESHYFVAGSRSGRCILPMMSMLFYL